jgi:hypothetical protein
MHLTNIYMCRLTPGGNKISFDFSRASAKLRANALKELLLNIPWSRGSPCFALQTLPLLNLRASYTPPSVVPDILGVRRPGNYTLSQKNGRENCVLYYLKGEFRSVNQNTLKQ